MMPALNLEGKLSRAEARVRGHLAHYGGRLPATRIVLDPELDEETMATHRHPDTVVVREATVSESVLAHEMVHIAQGTLEYFRGFRLLYVLLAEGLADSVTKTLYPAHEVKYPTGCRLIELLVEADERVIGDLLRLNDLPLMPEDVAILLNSPHLAAYSRDLLGDVADRIRDSIHAANEAGIGDPTFVTLGEEVRAWKLVLGRRFDRVREEVDKVMEEWFSQQ
jgi:hypothetical protein